MIFLFLLKCAVIKSLFWHALTSTPLMYTGQTGCLENKDPPPMTLNFLTLLIRQCAKKVVSNSLGLVDFAVWLVNSVFNLLDGQVMIFKEFE